MIRNQWYAVLESEQVKKGKALVIRRMNEELAFWRKSDWSVGCISNKCAHRGASIGKGDVVDDHLQCPFHGLEYDETGQCVLIPANGKKATVPENFKVNAYPVEDKYGFIWIFYGQPSETYPEIPFIEGIDDSFIYSTFRDHWQVHYSLSMENQLDVSHLPFVHRTTIGKGNKTLVNGPVVKSDEDGKGFKVWVFNELDNHQNPKQPGDIPVQLPERLTVKMPNIWQNYISDDIRILAAFAPIDQENTLVYLRFYQRFMKIKGLGNLIAYLGKVFSIKILRQDKRVVETQRPKKSELTMKGQNLFQADYPIIHYRKVREALKKREE